MQFVFCPQVPQSFREVGTAKEQHIPLLHGDGRPLAESASTDRTGGVSHRHQRYICRIAAYIACTSVETSSILDHKRFPGCASVDRYQYLNKIDEGTYGIVFRAKEKDTGKMFALKQVAAWRLFAMT